MMIILENLESLASIKNILHIQRLKLHIQKITKIPIHKPTHTAKSTLICTLSSVLNNI
jgi:hypothetical protein